jgi:hypothetical protein
MTGAPAFSPATPDVRFENHGSLWLVRPLTDAASEWLEANLSDDAQWWAGAVACEPRYVSALADGMRESGLVLS